MKYYITPIAKLARYNIKIIFGNKFMYYSVTATRTVVHGIIVHQSRFLGNQVLGFDNIFFCHNHFSYLLVNRMKNSINLTNIAAPQT